MRRFASLGWCHGGWWFALAALVGCSSATTTGSHPAADAGAADAAADSAVGDAGHPATPSPIYGPCLADTDCQSGLTCLTPTGSGLPNGQCNRDCTVDDDCVLYENGTAVDGYCLAADPTTGRRLCGRVCQNGIDCERSDGYTCIVINTGTLLETDVCIGVCSDTTCGPGGVCDHQSGRCTTAPATADTGRLIGQSCVPRGQPGATSANACASGHCSGAATYDTMNRPTYTGFNGGSCYTYCVLPLGYNDSTLFDGPSFPQVTCPTGAVCFPDSDFAQGDLGVCVPSCAQDSDCRASEGYYCRKRFQTSQTHFATFHTGFCTPIDCADATLPPCPTGYTCLMRSDGQGGFTGTCAPST